MASAVSENGPKVRIILQQCLSAKLQVQPATDDKPSEFVQIKRGLVVYICFLKGASSDMIEKLVKSVLTVRLSEGDGGKLVSVLDLPGDVLIVPQATLGGRLKGRAMQYHSNIDKTTGFQLYTEFTELCKRTMDNNPVSQENNCVVQCGTYGNRQVLQIDTNGPYSHILEF